MKYFYQGIKFKIIFREFKFQSDNAKTNVIMNIINAPLQYR